MTFWRIFIFWLHKKYSLLYVVFFFVLFLTSVVGYMMNIFSLKISIEITVL